MNRQLLVSIIIFLFSVFISSVSQIILKKSSGKVYDSKIKEYMNIYVLSAYTIFFISTLITIYSYKNLPLSLGPVIEASGYFFIAVMDRVILKEKISKRKILGISVIISGILIVCTGG